MHPVWGGVRLTAEAWQECNMSARRPRSWRDSYCTVSGFERVDGRARRLKPGTPPGSLSAYRAATYSRACRIPNFPIRPQGYTCAKFKALPAHLRSADDAAVLRLSQLQRWKACPGCKHMVERTSGCNRMTCRCGAQFCYHCGNAYSKAGRCCTC
jgi:hypothetical protein